jgi:hypothetical protein
MAEPNKNGFGYLPAMKLGLTEDAEMINVRLAMVGIAAIEGKDKARICWTLTTNGLEAHTTNPLS